MASTLRYLTVPDFLYLNLELTKAEQTYRFDKLEEAVFYQYAYGQSTNLVSQAGRFLKGWRVMKPFAKGNDACAFIGFLAFLRSNGVSLSVSDAEMGAWVAQAWGGGDVDAMIEAARTDFHVHDRDGVVDRREMIESVLEDYPETVKTLLANEAPVYLREMAPSRLTGELLK